MKKSYVYANSTMFHFFRIKQLIFFDFEYLQIESATSLFFET